MAPRTPSTDATVVPTRMQAIEQRSYGSTDVLQPAERAVPEIEATEVLVRVHAAGLDRGTWHVMTGTPLLARLVLGLGRPKAEVPGLDLAGVVVAVGAEVTRFEVGDEVCGAGKGSFAEYTAAEQDKLVSKPSNVTFEQAAVVAISGMTAVQALADLREEGVGKRVLVLGASGGVGTFAVQIAKAFGAEVTGVCRGSKVELVRSLGADHVLDHEQTDPTDPSTVGDRPYDLILDIGGHRKVSQMRRVLARRGTLVIVGSETGSRITGGIGRSARAAMLSPFVRQRLVMLVSKERHEDLEPLTTLIEAGEVTPCIDRVYPLAQVADAMRRLESGEVQGKVALVVRADAT